MPAEAQVIAQQGHEELQVGTGRVVITQECVDALSVVAAVESGRGAAVVGEFITAVAGDRVRFVPFVSAAHFQEVGLLYRPDGLSKNVKRLIAASLPAKSGETHATGG